MHELSSTPRFRRIRITTGSSLVLLVLLALALPGCTRTVKQKVFDQDSVEIFLRQQRKGGSVVERNFQHPGSISRQRLAYILGAIDIETSGGKGGDAKQRRVAIHPEILEPIAKGLSAAFEEADSTQEIAVMAIRKQRRLGIFHKKFLTSFVAAMKDERLYLYFSRVEWEIPKEREGDKLPEPRIGEKQMAFRAVAGRKMTQSGSQAVAIRWHDPLFSAPVRSPSKVGGQEQRRTILMESAVPKEEIEDDLSDTGIDEMEPDTLRALADLEEARRSGSITEAEYQQRRDTLLGKDRF